MYNGNRIKRCSTIHLLIFSSCLLWFVGSCFVLIGYVFDLDRHEDYQLGVCNVTRHYIEMVSEGLYNGIIRLTYSDSNTDFYSDLVVVSNTDLAMVRFYLVKFYPIGYLIAAYVNYNIGTNSSLQGTISIDRPINRFYLTAAIVTYSLAFLLALLYITIHFIIYCRRRKYMDLNLLHPEDVTLSGNLRQLYDNSAILNSFESAQSIMWRNADKIDEGTFCELKQMQVAAVIGDSALKIKYQKAVYESMKYVFQ